MWSRVPLVAGLLVTTSCGATVACEGYACSPCNLPVEACEHDAACVWRTDFDEGAGVEGCYESCVAEPCSLEGASCESFLRPNESAIYEEFRICIISQ